MAFHKPHNPGGLLATTKIETDITFRPHKTRFFQRCMHLQKVFYCCQRNKKLEKAVKDQEGTLMASHKLCDLETRVIL